MTSLGLYPSLFGQSTGYYPRGNDKSPIRMLYSNNIRVTRNAAKAHLGPTRDAGCTTSSQNRRHVMQRHAALPQTPDISDIVIPTDDNADFVVLVSMYEVYNDRIFDLLESPSSHSATPVQKGPRRRPLLFKSTEHSPDRKVVAGLRKVVCADVDEALMVLETGLLERRVAGTGSNSLSSRSHGFFCVEVQKRSRQAASQWTKSTLTIVDLAGKLVERTDDFPRRQTPHQREIQQLTSFKARNARGMPRRLEPPWPRPVRSTRASCILVSACRCKAIGPTATRYSFPGVGRPLRSLC